MRIFSEYHIVDIFGRIKFSPKQLVTFVLCEYFAKLIFTKTVKVATSSMFSLTCGKKFAAY